jgi:Flp pilus assembly protein TadG
MNIGKPGRRIEEAGNATVEAAATMSVLLLLILSIVAFGQTLCAYNTMLLVAEEAGRYAMVHNHEPPDACAAQKQTPRCPIPSNTPLANCAAARTEQLLIAYHGSQIEVSVAEDRTSSPATMTICTSYPLDFLMPQLLPYGPLTIARQVTVPLI